MIEKGGYGKPGKAIYPGPIWGSLGHCLCKSGYQRDWLKIQNILSVYIQIY